MLAGIRPGCVFEFMDGELHPLFDDGDGFQAPVTANYPAALGTISDIPSNGSEFSANTVNPCCLLVPPHTPLAPKLPDMELL